MTTPPSRPVAIGLRLYRTLAGAFPQEFKNVYGDDMLQVADEAIEPIWQRHGIMGLIRLLADIIVRLPIEYGTEVRQDLRYGLRMLAGSPGFTAVALISLGLGICAPTCFFSELNGTVLRDIPGVAQPGELVSLNAPMSYPTYRRIEERSDLFTSTLAYVAPVPFGVSLGGRKERIWGHLVTPSYFHALGIRPALGRFFDETYEQPGPTSAVVVSYRMWQNDLGSDREAIGKTLRINGHACTILGIGPKEFLGASPMFFEADLWLPFSAGGSVAPELSDHALERRDLRMFQIVGRLRRGITLSRAEAELDGIAGRGQKAGRLLLKTGGKVVPIRKRDLPLVLALPAVVVGLLLLIASSNAANMMLARAASRRQEIAVRLAMGASRARLVRQLVTESMLIATGAGIIGLVLTAWLMRMTSRMEFAHAMPVRFHAEPDWRVLLFTLALTVFTGLVFGLAPALQATRMDLTPSLKEGGHVRIRRYRPLSLRNMMVVYQMAASLALVLVTGTVVVAFLATTGTDAGFDPAGLYLVSLDPIREGFSSEQTATLLRQLLDRMKGLPSISAAALTESLPMAATGHVTFSAPIANQPRATGSATKYVVGTDYFATIGIPILLGRGFRKDDDANVGTAVIVSEGLVRQYWSGESALGRHIEIESNEAARFDLTGGSSLDYRAPDRRQLRTLEVVGVAKDVKIESAMGRPRPAIYFPLSPDDYARPELRGLTLLVRMPPGQDASGVVRRQLPILDARLTTFHLRTMTDEIDRLRLPVRAGASGYGLMGIFGVILAAAGVAGVTAYAVTQRRHEIGIRIALGAQSTQVIALVMKEGATLVLVGTSLGMAGAWALIRVLSASVEPVARVVGGAASQPLMLLGAPVLLAGLALAACYIPVRKSTRIDPLQALRQD
jgi:predicted permease